MRTEWKLFCLLGAFMAPLGILYWFISNGEETAILLEVTAVAFFFIGLYLLAQSRRMNGLRPEDYNANPEDGEGEVGSFPVGSIFPFMGALGATLMSLGLVFNGFLAVPGLGFVLASIIGMARESTLAETASLDLDSQANPNAHATPGFDQAQVKK